MVTNDGRSSDLQVWSLGGDSGELGAGRRGYALAVVSSLVVFTLLPVLVLSDVVLRAGGLPGRRPLEEGGSRMAARPSSDPQVLHGATSTDLQLSQLTSGRLLFDLGNMRRLSFIRIIVI